MRYPIITFLLFALILLSVGCIFKKNKIVAVSLPTPELQQEGRNALPWWAINANIYEVNVRQYTPEGTFAAFQTHLPRLKEMGVDILWLMPVFPISEIKRKGDIGSPYSVANYKEVSPDYGTMEDFENLVKAIHEQGMYIILDWVPNHTGWDNPWITANPEWYTHMGDTITHPYDDNGNATDWYDVADLNYENADMRLAMIDALNFWIDEYDIDGYRCDVAFFVPDDFWTQVRDSFQRHKPLFMLAEAEHPPHRNMDNFQMSYGWHFHHLLNEIAKGKEDANVIDEWYKEHSAKFNKGFAMHFTSNHDENSWNGTVFERMGDAHKCLAVFAATYDGMPLIYSGMEEPLRHRLSFFGKDTIPFQNFEYADFYAKLLDLKHHNWAIWNGEHGGVPKRLDSGENTYSFLREKYHNQVFGIFNFSGETQTISLSAPIPEGATDLFAEEDLSAAVEEISLGPWDYKVYYVNPISE